MLAVMCSISEAKRTERKKQSKRERLKDMERSLSILSVLSCIVY